ncbi:sugar ABC transporter ATP-binding protein [Enterocloster bolteae]|jgi:ABC-type sugar transport system ATPase subunit|uniref:Sugar ABC transporter ATP-binding protein n=1 Tax=Enterocloster bolteae TaxID=208479 RepID=A0A412Z6A5_9FIRM|nr:sugar ABC transporter ATP-binding protein [Enterocloster bolteae]RGV75516.1 sugar ABC transporter ATP-binding protein [Enterocloster bolteae]
MAEYLLEMKQIVKQFPGTLALDHVDFTLEQGEVMALIGENGAGKSTLMNVLMGMLQPDSGEMVLRGQTITNRSPYEALQKGIGMVPQELNLVSDLSIAENIFLGLHHKKGNRIDWDHMRSKAKEMLDKLEVDIDSGKKISEVSAAYQQLVSIARTLVFGSNIIILDEPTASLTLNETEHLFKNIRKLKNEGKAIIMITHHLDEVLEIADRVTIMRDGKLIKISNTSDLSIDDMIYYMANQKVEKSQHIVRPVPDQVFLKVMGLCRGKEFQNVDFEVKKGEIFGVAGLVGAGRTELFSCLYGLTKKDKGKVYLEGKEVEITSPNEAISYGIGLVPEERRKQGMFPILSIYENIMMPNYHKVTRMGRINFSQAREAANHHIQALRIKTPDCLTQIKNLSGGNQQKVILGRWMEKQVKLFILDEPTRGIDVRAKGEIYKLIRDMADSGITVIVISSEIEELLTLADRIMIMNGGKVKGFVVPNEDMEREDILKVALH